MSLYYRSGICSTSVRNSVITQVECSRMREIDIEFLTHCHEYRWDMAVDLMLNDNQPTSWHLVQPNIPSPLVHFQLINIFVIIYFTFVEDPLVTSYIVTCSKGSCKQQKHINSYLMLSIANMHVDVVLFPWFLKITSMIDAQ